MLALTAPLMLRLQHLPQLAGWDVRTNIEPAPRDKYPAADVRCTGANVPPNQADIVTLSPEWTVTLVVRHSDAAAAQLEAAFAAVVAALHGWQPGQHSGRGWTALRLVAAKEPLFTETGLAGIELFFSTSAKYHGAGCAAN